MGFVTPLITGNITATPLVVVFLGVGTVFVAISASKKSEDGRSG